MKLKHSTIILFLLVSFYMVSQKVIETYIRKGNVYVKTVTKITNLGLDTFAILTKDKQSIIYLRHLQQQEIYQTQIVCYDLNTSTETVLVQSSENNPDISTPITYANSDNYPFSCLGEITNIKLSPDNDRIYFVATAWTVSSGIHYYEISTGKIYFFNSGWINKIYADGTLSIQITGLATDKNGNSGRYLQDWLYDMNGVEIKPLSKRKF